MKMAAALLPRMYSPTVLSTVSFRRFTQKLFPSLSIAIPGVSLNLPTIDDIWESVLRAVPKNKVSHSRKRHRQMAGKALEDVKNLCRCPGCGAIKRTHRLCQNCLEGTSSYYESIAIYGLGFEDKTDRRISRYAENLARGWEEPSRCLRRTILYNIYAKKALGIGILYHFGQVMHRAGVGMIYV